MPDRFQPQVAVSFRIVAKGLVEFKNDPDFMRLPVENPAFKIDIGNRTRKDFGIFRK